MAGGRLLRKTLVVVVFAVGIGAATPVLAAHIAGTEVTVDEHVDVLNSNERTVYAKVVVERKKAPLATHQEVLVDHYYYRAQHEDYGDLSYGWYGVDVPVLEPYYIYEQEYDNGTPCITCKKIDRVCALIGDRC